MRKNICILQVDIWSYVVFKKHTSDSYFDAKVQKTSDTNLRRLLNGGNVDKTNQGVTISRNSLIFTVGAKGFEPSTPCSQSRCASRTAPYPEKKDDSASSSFSRGEGGIRTPGIPCGIRQFSKLLVSATHPPLQRVNCGCKNSAFFITRKRFLLLFFK